MPWTSSCKVFRGDSPDANIEMQLGGQYWLNNSPTFGEPRSLVGSTKIAPFFGWFDRISESSSLEQPNSTKAPSHWTGRPFDQQTRLSYASWKPAQAHKVQEMSKITATAGSFFCLSMLLVIRLLNVVSNCGFAKKLTCLLPDSLLGSTINH